MIATEIHYTVQDQGVPMEYKISSAAVKNILDLDSKFIFGESLLFNYDSTQQLITLSPAFQKLLVFLVQLNELDPKILKATSFTELNAVLQQPQGLPGGFLRKEGLERWHLEDGPNHQEYRQIFDLLFKELGFFLPKTLDHFMEVDHCIIFGATMERMEKRVIATIGYLKNQLHVKNHLVLLGSQRKLIPIEVKQLHYKIESLEEKQKKEWLNFFEDQEQLTEANAFIFLWRIHAPKEMQVQLEEKLVSIKSTRMGSSYREHHGHRTTLEVTVEDWLSFYDDKKTQTIFAVAELPYLRLADQLRMTVISKGKKASFEELFHRIKNTTFYFSSPLLNSSISSSVLFDEIGRTVYRVNETLKYLEAIPNQ